MKEGFDIHIKDNFLDEELYKLIYDKIPFYIYGGNYGYHNVEGKLIQEQNSKPEHLFYGAKVEENISNHIKEKCEKLYGKKFKENYSAYTMVTRTTPMVHCDKGKNTSHQIIIYIRGDEGLNRGTGFYVKNNDVHELNTHIGFKENRAIFWESSVYHSPLIWSDDNKSKRFSIIAQYKEIK